MLRQKKGLCTKWTHTAHCHVCLVCFKIISFSLLWISFGIRGSTNIPAQYIRDTRKLRVPSDRETIHGYFQLSDGKEKPNTWNVQQRNPAQAQCPPGCPLEPKGIFHCPTPWHCILSLSVVVKCLQTQSREQIYGVSAFTGLQEYPGGYSWDNSPELREEWAGWNRENAKHNLCPRVHLSMNLSAMGLPNVSTACVILGSTLLFSAERAGDLWMFSWAGGYTQIPGTWLLFILKHFLNFTCGRVKGFQTHQTTVLKPLNNGRRAGQERKTMRNQ